MLAAIVSITACHSYHVDATVENRTGSDIQLLEVDYPSASFGADRIVSGAIYNYRFQIRGSGPLKITYTGPDDKQVQIPGPTLVERQQGQLKIVLLPLRQGPVHPTAHAFLLIRKLSHISAYRPKVPLNAKRRSPFPASPPVQLHNVPLFS